MDYGFTHAGRTFTPNATTGIDPAESEARNKAIEAQELDWLRSHPERGLFLYVSHPKNLDGFATRVCNIHTWLGTVVSSDAELGPRSYVGFGFNTWRRSVRCRIFGVRYVGWYYESSGDYCRLRKAKKQN